ncbi:MAG: GIY-YIG nuclease family protein [Ruminococcus sp.]|nr:GIY-YIG nuclease family protein [Ruminococcus sp.]
MSKGIIYIMTTVVPGLIKIGKTGCANFEQRMYNLEHNGYCNATALKRSFAIEVENYDEKEALIHTIFEKSRVSDTELFALDVNIVTQLLTSFDGTIVYPKTETKADIFENAVENQKSRLIPNGTYTFKKKKKSDNRMVKATAVITNGKWKLKKGSIIGIAEDVGMPQNAKSLRLSMQYDNSGKLLEDVELGECSPSFAGDLVMNQSINGWTDWKDKDGNSVDIYRKKNND